MLAKREDLMSWVLRVFNCYRTKFEFLIVNVCFSAKFWPYRFCAILEHSLLSTKFLMLSFLFLRDLKCS